MNKKENHIENYYKRQNINLFKKFNKKVHFSNGKKNSLLNMKIKPVSTSSGNINKNPNLKYLNYRQKLLNRCNSQILNNQILPIITNNHRYSYNNMAISIGDNSKMKKISFIKSPNSSENINNSKISKFQIPILYNSNNVSINNINKEEKKNKDLAHSTNVHNILNYENNKPEIKNNSINNKEGKNQNKEINTNQKSLQEKEKLDLKENNIKKEEENNLNEKKETNEENTLEKTERIEQLTRDLQHKKKPYKYRPYKFSKFYKLSKNRNVSARNIYAYYIQEEIKENNIPDPIDNFTKFIEKKYRNPSKKFNKLYGLNKPYLVRLQEIKNNNSIAYKDDFDLKEYQNILCGMIKKRVRNDNIYILKEDFKKFNEKLNKGFLSHKGRFSLLAEKIRYNAPSYLVDKLRKLDEDKLKAKAKYFNINLNKKRNADIDYALDDFDFYLENKFIPNLDDKYNIK